MDRRSPFRAALPRKRWYWLRRTFVLIMIVTVMLRWVPLSFGTSTGILSLDDKNKYQGVQFWNEGKTVEVKTLYETPFARFQIHKVRIGNKIIDDWLWCDEMDHINVLVRSDSGDYIIFRQSKYGLPGPPTLAVVGGLLEPGEEPLQAAQRELMEELKMKATEWVSLGKYRAAVNRGGGMTHVFLAKNAVAVNSNDLKFKGQADLERQDVVRCTEEELLQYVLDGQFGEIKWTATVALSLLKLRS